MDSPCRRHKHPSLKGGVTRAQVRQELADLYHNAGYTGPVDLQWTDELRQTHDANTRRYAQVMPFLKVPHFEFAPQMAYLPLENRRALEAHELGHVLAPYADEDGADEAARRALGIRIEYDHRWPGKGLQTTRDNPSERERVREAYRRWSSTGDPKDREEWKTARRRIGLAPEPASWPRCRAVQAAGPTHKRKRMRVAEAEGVIMAWLRGRGWDIDLRARSIQPNEVWISPDERQRMRFKRATIVFEHGARGDWHRNYDLHRWGDPLSTIDFAERLLRNTKAKLEDPYARNPDLPSAPRDERFLPARIQARGAPPRRHSFDLMAAGEEPLIYLPAGAVTTALPRVAEALGIMLSRRPLEGGLADPRAWYDLESVIGHQTTAKLYVVDRNGERWRVLRVNMDPGGYSGEIQVQHLGRHSRGGRTRWLDPEQFYGQMLPVVVFKGRRQ